MTLRGDKYETAEEIRMRLESTVVLYEGAPVYIAETALRADPDGPEFDKVFFHPLPLDTSKAAIRKLLSSKKFDLSPFRMGYLNFNRKGGGDAAYCERDPHRQNKQGLSANSFKAYDVSRKKRAYSLTDCIRNPGFVDMVAGKYPSFNEARKMLREGWESVAVSRGFAVTEDKDLDLLCVAHKGVKCGIILGDEGVRLAAKHAYLRESLLEYNIPVHAR